MNAHDRLAADTTSSATALLSSAARLLREARAEGPEPLARAADAVCRAQPAMGALWNAAAAALADEAVFDRLLRRAARSPAAAARFAADLLRGSGRLITCSQSAMVEEAARTLRLPVRCAESRPGLEGRALAASLAAGGLAVELVSDAAVAADLQPGDVVAVGADAVAAGWFINKVGTGALCAAATLAGVPCYVIAGREKFVGADLAGRLRLRADDPRALWDAPPEGIVVSNPLFERVPLDRVAGVITDIGLLAGDLIGSACEATLPEGTGRRLLDRLKDW